MLSAAEALSTWRPKDRGKIDDASSWQEKADCERKTGLNRASARRDAGSLSSETLRDSRLFPMRGGQLNRLHRRSVPITNKYRANVNTVIEPRIPRPRRTLGKPVNSVSRWEATSKQKSDPPASHGRICRADVSASRLIISYTRWFCLSFLLWREDIEARERTRRMEWNNRFHRSGVK